MKKIILILAFLITQGVASDLPDTVRISSALKRLHAFIIEQDEQTPPLSPCLNKPLRENPLDYYKDVVAAYAVFKDQYQDQAAITYIPEYANLATTLLEIIARRSSFMECTNLKDIKIKSYEKDYVCSPIYDDSLSETNYHKSITEPRFKLIDNKAEWLTKLLKHKGLITSLEQEIISARSNKNAHYKWFMLFNDKLSDLASTLINVHSFANVNTRYAHYLYQINLKTESGSAYKKEADYRIGNYATNNILSLPALINNCPGTIMLPYLFELSPYDFLDLTVNEDQLFWPCGLLFHSIAADGWYHCPRQFFGHDWHHLSLLAQGSSGFSFLLDGKKPFFFNAENMGLLYKTIANSHYLYCQTLNAIKKAIDGLPDGDQKKLFEFFGFHIVHESIQGILAKVLDLRDFLTEEFYPEELSGELGWGDHFLDPLYYYSLIPPSYSQDTSKQTLVERLWSAIDILKPRQSLPGSEKINGSLLKQNVIREFSEFQRFLKANLPSDFVEKLDMLDISPYTAREMKQMLSPENDLRFSTMIPQHYTYFPDNSHSLVTIGLEYTCFSTNISAYLQDISKVNGSFIINFYYGNGINFALSSVMPETIEIFGINKPINRSSFDPNRILNFRDFSEVKKELSAHVKKNRASYFLKEAL